MSSRGYIRCTDAFQIQMLFPDCTNSVPPGVTTILVGLTTSTCFWEGHCKPPVFPGGRGCIDTKTAAAIAAASPDEFTTLSVSNSSLARVYSDGENITDTVGSSEFWCDGTLPSVSLGPDSWLIGTQKCVVGHLSVTGTGAHVEGIAVESYGSLVGIGLELVDIRGDATAVVAPAKGAFSVKCGGLTVFNSRVAVGGCRDVWSADGPDTVAIYQASSRPTGTPGTLISIDSITDVFGRPYEARFYEGATDVDAKREIFRTSLVFLGTSAIVLFTSWWLVGWPETPKNEDTQ